jgi:hypothetical protein
VRLSQATHFHAVTASENHGSRSFEAAHPSLTPAQVASPFVAAAQATQLSLHRTQCVYAPQPSGEAAHGAHCWVQAQQPLLAATHDAILLRATSRLDVPYLLHVARHCMPFLLRQCHSLGRGLQTLQVPHLLIPCLGYPIHLLWAEFGCCRCRCSRIAVHANGE